MGGEYLPPRQFRNEPIDADGGIAVNVYNGKLDCVWGLHLVLTRDCGGICGSRTPHAAIIPASPIVPAVSLSVIDDLRPSSFVAIMTIPTSWYAVVEGGESLCSRPI